MPTEEHQHTNENEHRHHHTHGHGDQCCGCPDPHCGEEEGEEVNYQFRILLSHSQSHYPPHRHNNLLEDYQMELEFRSFVRENYPQSELEADSDEIRQEKLGALLEKFQAIKIEQEKQTQILAEKVKIIQERFPVECSAEYKKFFDINTWKNALIQETKAGFDSANASMADPSQGLSLPPLTEVTQHVYEVKMYNDDFLKEISNFVKYAENWLETNEFNLIPPNSMNRYGLSLEHLGLGPMFTELVQYFFQSIVPNFYPFVLALMGDDEEEAEDEKKNTHPCCDGHEAAPEEKKTVSSSSCCSDEKLDEAGVEATTSPESEPIPQDKFPIIFDNVHTFTVQYRLGNGEGKGAAVKTPLSHKNISQLNLHTDASHLTLNLCLGEDFSDGDLFLKGHRCLPHQQIDINPETSTFTEEQLRETSEQVSLPQVPGSAYIHTGTLRHGAEPITNGFRQNLIIWAVSDRLRKNFRGQYFGPCFVCAMDSIEGGEHDHDHHEDGACCSSSAVAAQASETTEQKEENKD